MKRYDQEFKENVVKMLVMEGRPIKVLARELGVSYVTLKAWKDKYLDEADRHPRGEGMPSPRELVEENKRLRHELERAARQRDILKKAMSILSEMSPGGMQ